MTCFNPLIAVRDPEFVTDKGKFGLKFLGTLRPADKRDRPWLEAWAKRNYDQVYRVPCGKCYGCLLDKCADVALRATVEARSYSKGCFLTLTYDEAHLPAGRSIYRKHLTDFLKRLRKHVSGSEASNLKFLFCAEYGTTTDRPHYHVLVLGWRPRDVRIWRKASGKSPSPTFYSHEMEQLWPFGRSIIGLDFKGAAAGYISRYSLKKRLSRNYRIKFDTPEGATLGFSRTGKALYVTKTFSIRGDCAVSDPLLAFAFVHRTDPQEVSPDCLREAEFVCYSMGMGKRFCLAHAVQLMRDFHVKTPDGRKRPLPRYFRYLLDKFFPDDYHLALQSFISGLPEPPTVDVLDARALLLKQRTGSLFIRL